MVIAVTAAVVAVVGVIVSYLSYYLPVCAVSYWPLACQGTADYAMQKLTEGGYFVTIAGSLSSHPKAGVSQHSFINSDTNLGNLQEMDALTAIANAGVCVARWRAAASQALACGWQQARRHVGGWLVGWRGRTV
jgi:hypothetical protein